MNMFLRKLVLGSLLIALSGAAAFAQARVATVDLNKVFNGYWKKKEAEATIKERGAEIEKELKSMVDDLKKARETYQKLVSDASDQAVSPEEREKRKKLAEDKLKEVKEREDTAQQYNRSASTSLDEQKKRVRDNIITEIRNVIVAKAKKEGFSLVIDSAAETINQTPFVLFNNNDNDVTEAIIKDLNVGAPSQASASGEKGNEKKSDKKK